MEEHLALKLNKMKKINFTIVAPPYRDTSGGIMVLHELQKRIINLGYNCIIDENFHSPKILSESEALNTVVIYPEIVMGNPTKAKHVVRWLLNTPGVIGGDEFSWGDTDLVYKQLSFFDCKKNYNGYLHCFDYQLDTFQNFNNKRPIKNAVIIRKGKKIHTEFNQHPPNSIIIDPQLTSNFEAAKLFNQIECLYSYDPITYYSNAAALCGVTSIVIPDPKMPSKEFYLKNKLAKFGVAYGQEYINHAIKTKHLVKKHLIELSQQENITIKNMIQNCVNIINQK